LEPTPWPDKASGTSVWVSTIRSPARVYSTKATASPVAISNRLAAELSFTSDRALAPPSDLDAAVLAGAAAFAVRVGTGQKSPLSEESRRMATGTVKWFNPDKGFGFIQPEDGGKDVFVHITAVQAAGLQSLNENQKVTYEVVTERGKQAAANLRLA
jgi:CspA family cold shock protein